MAGPSSSANTVNTLNGLYKEVYADKIKKVVPEGTKLQKKIEFVPKAKETGNLYHQPVLLAYEQGFTFLGPAAGVVTLQNAVAGVMKDAQVAGSQLILRAQMDYETAARAAKGRNAFVDSTGLMFESMQKSMRKRLEAELFYGQMGIGNIYAVSGTAETGVSLAANQVAISAATFAPGIWSGAEGMGIDWYNNTTLVATTTVTSVDLANRIITLDTNASLVAGYTAYYQGAYGNEMAGLQKIMSNTGTLFNINATTYTLWQSVTSSAASAALTLGKINNGISVGVGKGLDEDLDVFVNPKTWGNLMNDMAAQRRFTESMASGAENGAKSIEFYSQNGKISIEPSIYVKESLAFGVTAGAFKRIGASDVTFKTPGNGDQIFFHLPTQNGFECRAYTDQALFCEAPGRQILWNNIVNS